MILDLQVSKPHRSAANRFALSRIYWQTPNERGASGRLRHEVSIAVCWEPRDLWAGLFWEHNECERWVFYLCVLPCFPLRIKYRRHWG